MFRQVGLARTYRHMNRYREIITVLAKYGFEDLVSRSNLEKYVDHGIKLIRGKEQSHIASLSRWERMRMAMEELGTTFIKFGQIMSNRPDLLPKELIVELEKLQDAVTPFSAAEAQQLIEEELQKPINDLFLEYINIPVASASVAQVHKAILPNGETVAVKVQRPGIERLIEVDLEIMHHLATIMSQYSKAIRVLNPAGIVKEFERSIKKEIDFTIEASNIERFGRNFQGDPTIYVPKVYREYTTRKVLTMEYVDGIKVSEIDKLLQSGNDPKIIASRGADLVIKQMFEHSFFHADPHPGNILVLEDNVICFLDFGMMGVLLPNQKESLGNIIIGVVNKDANKITKTLLRLSGNNHYDDIDQLEYQIAELLEQYAYLSFKDFDMGVFLNRLLTLALDFQLKLRPDIYLLVKALVTVEDVGSKLDPDFILVTHMEPFARKLMRERLSTRRMIKDTYNSASEFMLMLRDLPAETRDIVRQLNQGQLQIDFEHKGLEPLLKNQEQISNRVAFAIVLASLILGSSLIVLAGIPPKWNDISIIGIVGFLGAGFMGFWLLSSIMRHGRM